MYETEPLHTRFDFMDIRDIASLGTRDLRNEMSRLLDGYAQDARDFGIYSDSSRIWQEEIAWVLRESQIRVRTDDEGEEVTLYDREMIHMYRAKVRDIYTSLGRG